jgi:hypothetical protein
MYLSPSCCIAEIRYFNVSILYSSPFSFLGRTRHICIVRVPLIFRGSFILGYGNPVGRVGRDRVPSASEGTEPRDRDHVLLAQRIV